MMEVYGGGLASTTVPPTVALPVPITFNGTQILVGGFAAPLLYLSGGQLNVHLPSELVPGQEYMAVASVNEGLLPIQIDTIPLQPGVAAYADGHVEAEHTDFSLVNVEHPAKPGKCSSFTCGVWAPPIQA
jgi:uncharacterized protein (TIGR03437 family)